MEPRAVRGEDAARSVHRRRRARARRFWTLRTMAVHEPVMPREVLEFLAPENGGVFVDCTVGPGGHAKAMLESGATKVIALDRDPTALALAARNLGAWCDRVVIIESVDRSIE